MKRRPAVLSAAVAVLYLEIAGCAMPQGPSGQPPSATVAERAIHSDVPAMVDPAARYLFYLHNRAVELQGPNAKTPWGPFRYTEMVNAFVDEGFVTISEARPASTQLAPYAAKVAGQVAKLLAAGVPPDNITVTGFSKGGAIAVLTTAMIGNPRVNFVVMAGCLLPGGPRTPADVMAVGKPPQGRILSIYDQGDTEAATCAGAFEGRPGVTFKEIVLREGRGHGLFLTGNKVWLGPVVEWARR